MTKEQLRQNAAAMLAFAEGKQVEARSSDGSDPWTVLSNPNWTFYSVEYRPKPEPVTRQWSKPEDVPLNCYLRSKHSPLNWSQIVGANSIGFVFVGRHHGDPEESARLIRVSWLEACNYEVSTDRKTWHACTVTEPAQ